MCWGVRCNLMRFLETLGFVVSGWLEILCTAGVLSMPNGNSEVILRWTGIIRSTFLLSTLLGFECVLDASRCLSSSAFRTAVFGNFSLLSFVDSRIMRSVDAFGGGFLCDGVLSPRGRLVLADTRRTTLPSVIEAGMYLQTCCCNTSPLFRRVASRFQIVQSV